MHDKICTARLDNNLITRLCGFDFAAVSLSMLQGFFEVARQRHFRQVHWRDIVVQVIEQKVRFYFFDRLKAAIRGATPGLESHYLGIFVEFYQVEEEEPKEEDKWNVVDNNTTEPASEPAEAQSSAEWKKITCVNRTPKCCRFRKRCHQFDLDYHRITIPQWEHFVRKILKYVFLKHLWSNLGDHLELYLSLIHI